MSAKHQVDAIRDAQQGKASTRVPGHQMPYEGKALDGPNGWPNRQRVGVTFCSCGAQSPVLNSNSKRQAWHRQHKVDVLTAGQS